jgi:hypothetical protein
MDVRGKLHITIWEYEKKGGSLAERSTAKPGLKA